MGKFEPNFGHVTYESVTDAVGMTPLRVDIEGRHIKIMRKGPRFVSIPPFYCSLSSILTFTMPVKLTFSPFGIVAEGGSDEEKIVYNGPY